MTKKNNGKVTAKYLFYNIYVERKYFSLNFIQTSINKKREKSDSRRGK